MAAGTRRITTDVAAGTTVENILQGMAIEFPGRLSQIEVYGAVIAAGAGSIIMDVQFGTDLVAEALVVPIEFAAGEGPRVPDHLLVVDGCGPADRLIVRLRNTDAVNDRECYTLVRVQPV